MENSISQSQSSQQMAEIDSLNKGKDDDEDFQIEVECPKEGLGGAIASTSKWSPIIQNNSKLGVKYHDFSKSIIKVVVTYFIHIIIIIIIVTV